MQDKDTKDLIIPRKQDYTIKEVQTGINLGKIIYYRYSIVQSMRRERSWVLGQQMKFLQI